ncbi:hypothetical protein GCM10010400_61390 [Streptomyces aculeolatus]
MTAPRPAAPGTGAAGGAVPHAPRAGGAGSCPPSQAVVTAAGVDEQRVKDVTGLQVPQLRTAYVLARDDYPALGPMERWVRRGTGLEAQRFTVASA